MAFRNLLILIGLSLLWGPSFLFIKISLEEIGPLTLAALRIGLGALAINLYLIFAGRKFIRHWKFWLAAGVSGFFAQGLPFILINWGEQYIDSALASILNGLTPIFTIIIANFSISDERMNFSKMLGTSLGFLGLITLISPSFNNGLNGTSLGILAVSIAAVSYGVALVYSRIHLKDAPPLSAPASQLLVTSLYIVPLAFVFETPTINEVSIPVIGSVLFLAIFGTALAFIIYFYLLEKTSASYVSQVTYLMPLVGVVLGITFLNETLMLKDIIGGGIILLGVIIVNKAGKQRQSKKRRRARNPEAKSIVSYSIR